MAARKRGERGFLSFVFSTSAGSMITRLTGYVRELAMVAFIGPTTFADIFYLVYAVPNMLRRLLGEGALTSALIPVFKSVETEDGAEEARKFASRVITLQVVATSAFTLLVIAGCVALWLFSEENSLGRVYAEYTAAIVPYAIFICAAALFGALLNTRGVYFVPPLMQTLINLVWIAASVVAGLVVGARYGLLGLSLSIVAACAVGAWLLWRLLAMKGVRVSLTLSEKLKTARMKGFLRMFGITLIGVASYPVNLLADRFMAQFIVNEEGAVTCLYQGDRLMQVPFGVLAVSIGTVALAELSKVAADKRRFFAGFTRAMRLSLFLAVPMAAVMALLSTQIVDLTLNYGEFANLERIRALDRTSLALLCYSLGLPGYFAVTCLTRSYFARQEMLTPVKVSWWMVALNIGLNILLLWLTDLGEAALALSSAAVALLNATLLFTIMGFKWRWIKAPVALSVLGKVLPAAAIALAACWGCVQLVGTDTGGLITARLVRFAVPAIAFFAVFALVVTVLRLREARDILSLLRRRG